jgi:hypothetical protein
MKTVWLAIVETEACDRYTFAFSEKPEQSWVNKLVWQQEGSTDDPGLAWYEDLNRVTIQEINIDTYAEKVEKHEG